MTRLCALVLAVATGLLVLGFLEQFRKPQTFSPPLATSAEPSVTQPPAQPTDLQPIAAIPRLASEVKEAVRSALTPTPRTEDDREVPFTAQAPFADWDDPRQQDGCEEASLVMAWHWLKGTSFTKQQALEEILALSRWSEEHLGEWRSTNAEDTAKLFRDYYNHEAVRVHYDVTAGDIRAALEAGSLVIVPADGTKLGNPYYRQPGPPEHMLVVLSYDAITDEFITNDPGTRRGQGYRYKSAVLLGALKDYPTGHREPNPNPRTAMIVVTPEPQ